MLNYKNIPYTVGLAVSNNLASLHELQTVYSLEDLFDLIEIMQVDAYNTKELTRKS